MVSDEAFGFDSLLEPAQCSLSHFLVARDIYNTMHYIMLELPVQLDSAHGTSISIYKSQAARNPLVGVLYLQLPTSN